MKRAALLLALPLALSCGTKKAPVASGAAEAPTWPGLPEPGPAPSFEAPVPTTFELSNGLPVTLVQTGKVPLVRVRLNVRTGSAEDPAGMSGLAAFTADMLNEGTSSHSALELSMSLQDLATGLGHGADLEYSYASMDCLEDKLPESLALLASTVMAPTFPEDDVERVRTDRRNQLLQAKDRLPGVGFDVFRRVLFGNEYLGRDSSGRLEDLDAITRDEIVRWHSNVWGPGNASLVVVGRLPVEQVKAALEDAFGSWKDSGIVPTKSLVAALPARGRSIYWVDRPNTSQSFVVLGNVGPEWAADKAAARELGNRPLGGAFTSRINLNLREDKSWTYGARSTVEQEQRSGMFAAYASVKAVHTADSLAEFLKEIEAALGAKPLAQGEFEAGQSGLLQGFPGRFEGLSGVMGQYGSADALQRPENWVAGFPGRVAAVDLAQAQQALSEVVSASDLVIVIVGDHAAHGAAVAELGISPITLVDDAATPVE